MSKCKGYASVRSKAPLAPYSFERRELREHDVVIDIKYYGICHSDIHQTRDEWSDYQEESIFPIVPGHEIAGVVATVGSKVRNTKLGTRSALAVSSTHFRTCAECQSGLEQYCSVQTVWTKRESPQNNKPLASRLKQPSDREVHPALTGWANASG